MTPSRPTFSDTSKVISKRMEDLSFFPKFFGALLRILCMAFIVALLFVFVFGILAVRGNAMYPSIRAGDLLLYYRLDSAIVENDVVVYTVEGRSYVGRVVAVGGQTVEITSGGVLLIDGHERREAIYYDTLTADGSAYYATVQSGQVFILGDLRTAATDSRDFGAINLSDVQGTVITLLRRSDL